MKHTLDSASLFHPVAVPHQALADTLERRFGLQVAARLNENAASLGADLDERLRFARERALERARAVRKVHAPAGRVEVDTAGVARLSGGSGWWFRIAAVLPALALAAGLVGIEAWQDEAQTSTAAEIDASLLADDLPPAAYSDAGFLEFLKTPPRE